jgi:pyrroloquinoline quinone (PQQ) biosynthesis protein C
MKTDEFIEELWGYAAEVPMEQHPWFDGIIEHRWSKEQIILGEVQHYLRVRTNPIFFGHMAINAVSAKEYAVMATVLENFMEELGGKRTHVDIMLQFLEEGGITREEADNSEPAPGTLAAIEMIIGCCQRRSALEGVAMLAFVESQLGGEGKISEKSLSGTDGILRLLRARRGNLPTARRPRRGTRQPANQCDTYARHR